MITRSTFLKAKYGKEFLRSTSKMSLTENKCLSKSILIESYTNIEKTTIYEPSSLQQFDPNLGSRLRNIPLLELISTSGGGNTSIFVTDAVYFLGPQRELVYKGFALLSRD